MDELIRYTNEIGKYDFPLLMFLLKALLVLFIVISIILFVYDRYIQRENQLLINYPLIGRLRYVFYALRDPMRQYFGDEKFYDSFDKVKWVYKAAQGKSTYASFSPEQPLQDSVMGLKTANCVYNLEDVSKDFSVRFGNKSTQSFTTQSIFGRSAMSDGAISPEGTRAFTKGAFLGKFPINTGEGGLTSNFLYTHKFTRECRFFEVVEGTWFAKGVYRLFLFFFHDVLAQKVYKDMVVTDKAPDSYLFDKKSMVFYRVNWDAPLKEFPTSVPDDVADIVLQIGSGLYGVRNTKGEFDSSRYEKVMRFCAMTEIKIAQGAKQTGGKLLADKVSEEIAYYRGVLAHQDLISPNQFPYAATLEELFDFVGRLKQLSNKPVGIKIVISDAKSFEEYAALLQERIDAGSDAFPDFITIDGAKGGSGAAPLEMMMRTALPIHTALPLADTLLRQYNVRKYVTIIASEKVLTPDDAAVLLALGADFIAIARAFMMSAGCIRARECSGSNGRACPVGLATQDRKKRASFLVEKKAQNIARYHAQLIEGLRGLFAVMGVKKFTELGREHLVYSQKVSELKRR